MPFYIIDLSDYDLSHIFVLEASDSEDEIRRVVEAVVEEVATDFYNERSDYISVEEIFEEVEKRLAEKYRVIDAKTVVFSWPSFNSPVREKIEKRNEEFIEKLLMEMGGEL